jgi:hypothetical protein
MAQQWALSLLSANAQSLVWVFRKLDKNLPDVLLYHQGFCPFGFNQTLCPPVVSAHSELLWSRFELFVGAN